MVIYYLHQIMMDYHLEVLVFLFVLKINLKICYLTITEMVRIMIW